MSTGIAIGKYGTDKIIKALTEGKTSGDSVNTGSNNNGDSVNTESNNNGDTTNTDSTDTNTNK